MRVNLPKVFSQFDDPWGKQLLGFNTNPIYNFHNFGCTTTSLTEVACYYNHDEHPLSLMEKLKALGPGQGYVANSGLYCHGAITKLFPDITERIVATPNALTNEQVQEIKTALDNHFPVMLQIDYNPKTLARDDHFVLAVDYNPKDENDIKIADSLGGKVHSLKDYLGWLKPNMRNSIEKYFIYSGPVNPDPVPVPQPQAQPVPAPVIQNIEGSQATVSGALPSNYAQIVHGSSQWDGITSYLELEKTATSDDVKRIIAGFKSTVTDSDNKRVKAEKEALIKDGEITTLNEQLSSVKAQALQAEKIHKAQLLNLKQTQPTFDKLTKAYDDALTASKGQNVEQFETIKQLREEVTGIKVDAINENGDVKLTTNTKGLARLISLIKRPFVIKI